MKLNNLSSIHCLWCQTKLMEDLKYAGNICRIKAEYLAYDNFPHYVWRQHCISIFTKSMKIDVVYSIPKITVAIKNRAYSITLPILDLEITNPFQLENHISTYINFS